jgi:hypothetical protein
MELVTSAYLQVYFPTMLAILGYLTDKNSSSNQWDEVLRKRVTFAHWVRQGEARPVTYDALTESLLESIRYPVTSIQSF